MNNWFECKIKYVKSDPNGKAKSVSETYLVDALTFAEAEERISKEVAPFISGDFMVAGLKKASYNEIVPSEDGDKWYKCKVLFITIDEVKATEKKTACTMLVLASDIKNAFENIEKSMSDSMSDYEVAKIEETVILDIFPYTVEDDESAKNEDATADVATDNIEADNADNIDEVEADPIEEEAAV